MAMIELLVDVAQLMSAANNMEQARQTYMSALDTLRSAADELASKWEGDGKVAYQNDQEAAFRWYNSMAEVVGEMIAEARRTAERYSDRIQIIKSHM